MALSEAETLFNFIAAIFMLVAAIGSNTDNMDTVKSIPWQIYDYDGEIFYVGVKYYAYEEDGRGFELLRMDEPFGVAVGEEGFEECYNSSDMIVAFSMAGCVAGFLATIMTGARAYLEKGNRHTHDYTYTAMGLTGIATFFCAAAFSIYYSECYKSNDWNYLPDSPSPGVGISFALVSMTIYFCSFFVQFFHQRREMIKAYQTFKWSDVNCMGPKVEVAAPASEEGDKWGRGFLSIFSNYCRDEKTDETELSPVA